MPGHTLAMLLNNPVCRYLSENVHDSVDGAAAQDPDVPTRGFSRARIHLALRDLRLVGVVEVHKNGCWTWRQYLDEVVALIKDLPGGLRMLEVLADEVGWSVIARLTLGQANRTALNMCGDSARVSDQLKLLRAMSAIEEEGKVVILLKPSDCCRVQDSLDTIASDIAMANFFFGRECAQHALTRVEVGARYSWKESFAEKPRTREKWIGEDADVEPGPASPEVSR